MGVFPWILYRRGVGKVDCKNVPSLPLFPVAISPLSAFLHLNPSRAASISYTLKKEESERMKKRITMEEIKRKRQEKMFKGKGRKEN